MFTVVGATAASSVATEPVRVRRTLRMLHGIEQEYREAFDDGGTLVRPIELEEAKMLLAEARDIARSLGDVGSMNVSERLATLGENIEQHAPVGSVVAECRALRESLVQNTGISDDVVPPAPPSASNGAQLYTQLCASCHGVEGHGDGDDAVRLTRRPPDFSDAQFMQSETPADFFLVISLGRRGGGMPAWEDVLSVQERWDLVSYVWFLGSDADGQDVRLAQALARVEERVREAVQAYRLQEDGAASIALDAYLSFEPLEARIAAQDPPAVARIEGEFARLQIALRQPQRLREVEAAAAGVDRALAAARGSTDVANEHAWGIAALVGISVAGLAAVILTRKRRVEAP
jgi:high-affinity iron transporter